MKELEADLDRFRFPLFKEDGKIREGSRSVDGAGCFGFISRE